MPFFNWGRWIRSWSRPRLRTYCKRRPSSARRGLSLLGLNTERLEDRVVPAVLPAPTVAGQATIADGFSPASAQDPLDPNKIVTVFGTTAGTLGFFASTDGGTTWASVTVAANVSPAFTVVTSPAVGIDRNHQVYITAIERSADNTQGALVFFQYDFSGPTPTPTAGTPFNPATKVLDRWSGTATDFDPILNSTIGVDNNVLGFDDPDTVSLNGGITGATNASPIVITTGSTLGLANGDVVIVSGVTGNGAANGTWTIGNITATTFELNGSSGSGAYGGGGTWTLADQSDTLASDPTNSAGTGTGRPLGPIYIAWNTDNTPPSPVQLDFNPNVIKAIGSTTVGLDAATVTAGGAGFQIGQILTLPGATPARLRVSRVNPGGVITAVEVADAGVYSNLPAGTVTLGGASFNLTWFRSFTSPQFVNDDGNFVSIPPPPTPPPPGLPRYADPQILFTQGSADGRVAGGQLVFVFSNFTNDPTASQTFMIDASQPDGGDTGQPIAQSATITGATGPIADAADQVNYSLPIPGVLGVDLSINNAGNNYAVGDVLQVQGPIAPAQPPSVAAEIYVSQINPATGAITGIRVINGGSYSTAPGNLPVNPVAVTIVRNTITGVPSGGTGALFDLLNWNGNITGAPAIVSDTRFLATVNLPASFTIADLDVMVSMTHPNMDEVGVYLIAADGATRIDLLLNQTDNSGTTLKQGLSPQVDLGTVSGKVVGTVFDDDAARSIVDPVAVAPHAAHFRPEAGSLAVVNGLIGTNALISGVWRLHIVDNLNDGTAPDQLLDAWSLHFGGEISTNGFGTDSAINIDADPTGPTGRATPIAGGKASPYTTTTNASGPGGLAPTFSIAIDNSLGGYSPYQGRLYLAYTAQGGIDLAHPTDTDVFMLSGDNLSGAGAIWTAARQVNDDYVWSRLTGGGWTKRPMDSFSEGNRPQFMPTVAVDQATGTVAVSYYDGRHDASNAATGDPYRVANFFQTSIDHGETFGDSVFLNTPKNAFDALDTTKEIVIEPVPGNQGQTPAINSTAYNPGFGDRQSLIIHAGRVVPVFASNDNDASVVIKTANFTVAAGPRIIASDMGPILADAAAPTHATGVALLAGGSGYQVGDILTAFGGVFMSPVRILVTAIFGFGFGPITGIALLEAGAYTEETLDPVSFTGGHGSGARASLSFSAPAIYNDTFAADGTRQLTGFYLQLDRPIDAGSLTSNQVTIVYRDAQTAAGLPGYIIPPAEYTVAPLDAGGPFGLLPAARAAELATTFRVTFLVPRSGVGTYSYAVGPVATVPPAAITLGQPGLHDKIKTLNTLTGNFIDQDQDAVTNSAPLIQTLATFPAASTIVSGGSGYLVGDVLTIPGTAIAPTQLTVIGVSPTGAVTNVSFLVLGQYLVRPAEPTDASGGTGSGASFNLDYLFRNDVYAIPTPINNSLPFNLPYAKDTLPLIIPGPYVVNNAVPVGGLTDPMVVTGGTNYLVNDILTVQGGTFTTPMRLRVAQVDPFNGAVVTAFVDKVGDYTAPPLNPASVTGGAGSGATFSLHSFVLNGTNNAIDVTFDRDMQAGPQVVFDNTGTGGSGARAIATVSGSGIVSVTMLNNGSGYTSAPTVSFIGGGGRGADAVATIDLASGVVTGVAIRSGAVSFASNAAPIEITSSGHGLSTNDVVTISGVTGNLAANNTFTITVIDPNRFSLNGSVGSGNYVTGGTWTARGTGYLASSFTAANILRVVGPVGPITTYTAPPSIVFSSPPAGAGNRTASGTAVLGPGGQIQSITILDGGSGYVSPPTIAFNGASGSGVGTSVNLTSGVVISVTVTNGGANYSMPITPLPDFGVNAGYGPGTLDSTLFITDTLLVNNLSVGVNINHARLSDLSLTLIAPDGTQVPLLYAGGASGTNFGNGGFNTIFDDYGATSISATTAPAIAPYTSALYHPVPGAISALIYGGGSGYSKDDILTVQGGTTFGPTSQAQLQVTSVSSTGVITGIKVLSLGAYTAQPSSPVSVVGGTGSGATFTLSFGALGLLNGKSYQGNWTLRVKDNASGQTGTLNSWSLNPMTVTPLPDAITSAVRTFRVTIPTQTISGTYAVQAGPSPAGNYVKDLTLKTVAVVNAGSGYAVGDVVNVNNGAGVSTQVAQLMVTAVNGTGGITNAMVIRPGSYSVFPSNPATVSAGGATFNLTFGHEGDINQNAGVDVLRGGDPNNGTLVTNSYTTGAITTLLPAGSTVKSTINVPASFLVQGVTVTFKIAHASDQDLVATLVAPDGTSVILFSAVTQSSINHANFTDTTLDDSASVAIRNASAPFTGTFNPQFPLSKFKDHGSLGNWTLQIKSNSSLNTGTLFYWTLNLKSSVPGSGLGEKSADSFTRSFRLFTQDPTNPVSQQSWTAVGGASLQSGQGAGRVTGLAIDPSDPSGNIVFAGGASGGVWKTTNFMTTDPAGPTWVSITDFGPAYSLNIGSIAVFNNTGDPNKSIVFVATGSGDELTVPPGRGSPGVGFLRSLDGGRTWDVLDGLTNAVTASNKFAGETVGSILPVNDARRDHSLVGTTAHKIIVDPVAQANGEVVVFAALSDSTSSNMGGVYRSTDSGKTWTRFNVTGANIPTQATDVALASGSSAYFGNLILYAAFKGNGGIAGPGMGGVFFTQNALAGGALPGTLSRLVGGTGNNLRQDFDGNPITGVPIPIVAPTGTPNVDSGRVLLAVPALDASLASYTADALAGKQPSLKDRIYQGWVYALVVAPDGAFQGYYLSKDFGLNWTQLHLPFSGSLGITGTAIPTNDETQPDYDVLSGDGLFKASLAIDPANPNVTYLGGDFERVPHGFIRVDATTSADAHALVAWDNSDSAADSTAALQFATKGGVEVDVGGGYGVRDPAFNYAKLETFQPDPDGLAGSAFFNLLRDPSNPFDATATLHLANINSNKGAGFLNTGYDTVWQPFGSRYEPAPWAGGGLGFDGEHELVTFRDPLTGHTRLIFGNDAGLWTSTDDGTGQVAGDIGTATNVLGSRNGNIQISQFYYGAAQPSTLAADLGGALFYGMAQDTGYPQSDKDILDNGNLNWIWPQPFFPLPGAAMGVGTDQTGSGSVYEYKFPGSINDYLTNGLPRLVPSDFFTYTGPNGAAAIGRTTGLLQAGDDPGTNSGQWPIVGGSNFAVNPIDGSSVVMSSQAGRIFLTSGSSFGYGVQWFVIADPSDLDGTYSRAQAFGAPDPGSLQLNNFIYVGTDGGKVFVTFSGGGVGGGASAWKDISAGLTDGTPIQAIVADPYRGSHDAYAVTQRGVYYMPDSAAIGATWRNITGDLFSPTLSRVLYNDPNKQQQTLPPAGYVTPGILTSLAVDWRYAIPDDLTSTTPTQVTGVFLDAAGGGYTSVPQVIFTGGGGTGAAATATINGANQVTGITMTDPGSGYTSQPVVTIQGGGGAGAAATATVSVHPVLYVGGEDGVYRSLNRGWLPTWLEQPAPAVAPSPTLQGVYINNGGSGYTSAPVVNIVGGGGTGATATANIAGPVVSLAVATAGSGYSSPPRVDFLGGGGSGAAAIAVLGSAGTSGQVVGFILTSRGSGYSSAPTISITGGGGVGAAGVATINASVVSVSVTNPGTGFTSAPGVVFDNTGTGGANAAATASLAPTNWTYFPNIATDGAIHEGGLLPSAHVTDLDLSLGDINPLNGIPNQLFGRNMLVATTYGRSTFAIRLNDNITVPGGNPLFSYAVSPVPGPHVVSVDQMISGNFLEGIRVTFSGTVDPATFRLGDINSVTDPLGNPVAISQIVDVLGVNPHNVYEIKFASLQSQLGFYNVSIGPHISDYSGNQMDQNQNLTVDPVTGLTLGANGETPGDIYTGQFLFQPWANHAPVVPGAPDQATATMTPINEDSAVLVSVGVDTAGSGYTSAPIVSIGGGGGTGATAVANISGPLTGINITGNGSGYTLPPALTFSGGGGTGAAATAVISGPVASVNLVGVGSGYTSAPQVLLTGGGGSGALATTTIVGPVVSILVTGGGGSGYTSAPNVSFVGGGGTGAAATAVISGGKVIAVNVTLTGSGYTSAPAVSFANGGGSGATATARLNGSVTSVSVTNGGSGYSTAPALNFVGGGGVGAAGNVVINAQVVGITITNQGSGYTAVPTLNFNNTGTGGSGGAATTTIDQRVVSITVTNPGSGYTAPPTVNLSGGGGSGAAATAYVGTTATDITALIASVLPAGGGIGTIVLTDGGSGYVVAPSLVFSGGGGAGAAGTAIIANGKVVGVAITAAGVGYSSSPSVSFDNTGTGGSGATAIVTSLTDPDNTFDPGPPFSGPPAGWNSQGQTQPMGIAFTGADNATPIMGTTVLGGGGGYISPPSVTFAGGGGSGAQATAVLGSGPFDSDQVVAIVIDPANPGSGYTSAPNIILSGGGGAGASAIAYAGSGTWQYATDATNAVQKLTFGGTITGGTFTLTFNGTPTGPIAWSATTATLQANIQAALDAHPAIGAGNSAVSNAANPTITFQNALSAASLPTMIVNGAALTGTAPTVDISTTTVGGITWHDIGLVSDNSARLFQALAKNRVQFVPNVNYNKDSVSGTISDASNAGPIVITTTTAHGLISGQAVTISGVTGNGNANGTFRITVLGPTSFSLNGSTGSGAYTPGTGVWNLTPSLTFRAWDLTRDLSVTGTDGGIADTTDPTGAPYSAGTVTVSLVVNPVNDPPSFTMPLTTTNSNEDAGAQTLANWVTNILPYPPAPALPATDEIPQTVNFNLNVTSGAALFTAGPAIDMFGTLTYTAAANQHGTAVVDVYAVDTAANGTVTGVTMISGGTGYTSAPSVMFVGGGGSGATGFATISGGAVTGVTITSAGSGYISPPALVLDNTGTGGTSASAIVNLNGFSAPQTFTIIINSVNDAPDSADSTVTILEDTPYTFTAADFPFTDPNDTPPTGTGPANNLLAVTITTLPAGTITNNGVAVVAGQSIPLADITGGKLIFTPAQNGNGVAFTSFDFQVQDDGGTANGGVDTDTTPNTITFNVTPVNDAPSFTLPSTTNSSNEDAGAQTFANWLTNILPYAGAPALPAIDEAGQTVTFTVSNDNNALFTVQPFIDDTTTATPGMLHYTAAPNFHGVATVTVTAVDNGGTANGGVDTSASQTFTITINSVNDAPSGADNTLTILEDAPYTFSTADFGFTDPFDTPPVGTGPANTLLAVEITMLPTAGTLTDNGVAVTAGQFIPVGDISGGQLVYTPAQNGNGTPYDSFTFQVQDDGTTAFGGIDVDPTANTITFNVTPVNDVPSFTLPSATTNSDEDAGAQTVANWLTNILPYPGAPALPAVDEAGQTVTFTVTNDNNALFLVQPFIDDTTTATPGMLHYTAAPNFHGVAIVTVRAVDNGGTANAGVDTSAAQTFTITINSVNDAPDSADKAVTILEDSTYVFAPGDFSFTDPNDTPPTGTGLPNNPLMVIITTLPTAGTLTNTGIPVAALQPIPFTDIAANKVVFTPAANQFGSPNPYATFTFQVQDDGGTAFGGIDTDPTPNTFTFNVTSVNDAPVGADKTVTILEDAPYVFGVGDFGFADPNDTPPTGTGPANVLAAVKISTLPAAGTLTDNGVAVAAGDFVPVADITGGNLVYTPAPNHFGAPNPYATFTFQVKDDGNTANGGVDVDLTPNLFTINVTSVNDAPVGTDKAVTLLEDTSYTFGVLDFGYSDPNDTSPTGTGPANNLLAVEVTTLPALGTLMDNGVAVAAGDFIPVGDITGGKLVYTPPANGFGVPYAKFTFQVKDDGSTANGGVDVDPTPKTITVNVTPVNDAPAGTDKTLAILEDQVYTFAAADFGFTDPNDSPPIGTGPGNSLMAVQITALPAAGTFTNQGKAVAAGDFIPVGDINTGQLVFTPAANQFGAPYATFGFKVQDDGGTANGGVDIDPTANTLTINVTSVNDAPVGTNNAVTMLEDGPGHVFTVAEFGFSDPSDTPPTGTGPANTLQAVVITTLPAFGTLTDNGLPVVAGQPIAVADIAGGQLLFTPAPNGAGLPYANFTFQVQDNGGTANGGVDTDTTARTMTLNVTPVNDAPSGADNTVTTLEDTAYVFAAADFGFSDPNDVPANALLAVEISALPALGTLADNGVAVTAGQFISIADINAGLLKYTPVLNANGAAYTSFTFRVRDDGGTTNGGIDIDPTPNTVTIDVTPVNDAPQGADKSVVILEDGKYTFATADFGFSDPSDVPPNALLAVKISALPSAGTLTDKGVAVVAGQSIAVGDISSGQLVFTPAANGNGTPYATFTFKVQDDGGTALGGVDIDPTANSFSINVTAVNDVPSFSPGGNQTVLEGAGVQTVGWASAVLPYPAAPAAPAPDENGQTLTFIVTVDNPALFITQPSISSNGTLTYQPSASANGVATVTVTLQDNGGTANGGADTSASQTFTITIQKNDTSITIVPSANPSALGENVTFTATVSSAGPNTLIPAGTVDFIIDGVTVAPGVALVNGQATYSTSTLTIAGSPHSVTVNYTNTDGQYNNSTKTMANGQTVNKGNSATTLISSNQPAIFGQAVTYTATVSPVAPAAGIPDGTVTFFVDGVSQLTVPVDTVTGQANFTTISLSVGTHTIRADYSGSTLFNSSTATFTQTVNRDTTTITVSSSAQPSRPGQPVIFTATIAPVTGFIVPDGGTVTFLLDGVAKGSAVVVAGEASLIISGMKLGSHAIVAQYSGNASFFGVTSVPAFTQNVVKTGTLRSKAVVTASATRTVYGQPVTFTVTVSSLSGSPTGAVTLTIDGVRQAPKNLVNGVATFTFTDLSVRRHRIFARYYGDDSFRAVNSRAIGVRVTKANTTVAVSPTVNPSVVGEPVAFTATVSAVAPGGGTPNGSVTFLVDNVQRGTAVLNASGQATLVLSNLTVGNHIVTVKYLGSKKYIASSTGINQVVQVAGTTASTTTVLSSLNPSALGQPVTFTANVSSAAGTPTGSITFVVDNIPMNPVVLVGGSASMTFPSLASGTHSVRAIYYGDIIHAGSSSSPLTQTVSGSGGGGGGGGGSVATGLAASLSNNNGVYIITAVALNAQNQQIPDFSGSATIEVVNGPGALTGGLNASFVNGSARFQVRVTISGTYTLRISSGGLETLLSFTTGGRQL